MYSKYDNGPAKSVGSEQNVASSGSSGSTLFVQVCLSKYLGTCNLFGQNFFFLVTLHRSFNNKTGLVTLQLAD